MVTPSLSGCDYQRVVLGKFAQQAKYMSDSLSWNYKCDGWGHHHSQENGTKVEETAYQIIYLSLKISEISITILKFNTVTYGMYHFYL